MLISDEPWIDTYIETMRGLLRGSHTRLAEDLDTSGIARVPADAGVFVLLDLRRYLDEPTWHGEHELWLRILEQARVNITPGSACRIGEPGFFRLCYAAQPVETVATAVQRIGAVLG